MGFPQLSNIQDKVIDTIKSKAGDNLRVSGTMPWIRVISCLDGFLSIESSKDHETFAQKYGDTSKSGRIGVDASGKDVTAVDNDRGLRPSPSIDSITISNGNEGLSKKSSFTIIAYSLGQCEKIMEYFLEPGNMVLVEWGDNQPKSVGQKTPIDKCAIAAYNNIKHVTEKRKNSDGTYDAVLGVITGGGMSYGDGETYNIQVDLTSVGELPAFLQHHRGTNTSTPDINSGDKFSGFRIAANNMVDGGVGTSLFMQMYNELPAAKRLPSIKALVSKKWATQASNFVNMDKEIREDLIESVKNGKLNTKGESGKKLEITSDIPMFSEKRFIRVALAFTILDMQEGKDTDSKRDECATPKTPGTVIWANTICRAHKNMFSADSNFLYIPNKHHPSFDLVKAMSTEDADFTAPITVDMLEGKFMKTKFTVDNHPAVYGDETKSSYFPNNTSLNFKDQADFDGTYLPLKAKPGEWGFLRDLYINFDFFNDTLKSAGLVTKDIYYTLLNGMSSATNLMWNFQILQRGHINIFTPGGFSDADTYYQNVNEKNTDNLGSAANGCEELQVVDVSFSGTTPGKSDIGKARFQSRGVNSPFLSAELNLSIPGAMKGQTIGSKLSAKRSIESPEQKEASLFGLVANKKKVDSVLEVLNAIKEPSNQEKADKLAQDMLDAARNTNEAADKAEAAEKEKSETKIATVKANYEFFVQNACIVPKIQKRSGNMDMVNEWYDYWTANNATIEEMVVVGAWHDSALLKKIQQFNEGIITSAAFTEANLSQLNVPLLPIEFNFSIPGVSGIKIGDTFNINDLPNKFKTKIFQVVQVEHTISQNLWTTNVKGKLRMIDIN